jgi:iron only hydrogenase large subunit-like protein
MERLFPVYTQETVCQDCYKCVRECPVKAIRVENERAYIVADRCVACGRCVRICPSGAKLLRNDVGRVKFLLRSGIPVYVSLAPSWVAVHPEWSAGQMIAALRRLGFKGVGETALGAQEVSAALARELGEAGAGLFISSACPAVVDLVRKHHPELAANITKIASPALTHCQMLRKEFGNDIGIVFIGPCAAKKSEADRNPDLMNLAITFAELDDWLVEAGVRPALFTPGHEDVFVPERATEGSLYPIEGGMAETMAHYGCPGTVRMHSISGLKRLSITLRELKSVNLSPPFFLEGLACRGGCVNGPCSTRDPSPIDGIVAVRDNARFGAPGFRDPALKVDMAYAPEDSAIPNWSETSIKEALSRVGK